MTSSKHHTSTFHNYQIMTFFDVSRCPKNAIKNIQKKYLNYIPEVQREETAFSILKYSSKAEQQETAILN